MAFCGKCGAQIEDGIRFCPACGAEQVVQNNAGAQGTQQGGPQAGPQGGPTNTAANLGKMFTDTKDSTNQYSPEDIAKGKTMSILAYFGILFFLPLVVCPDSKYGRFHANQGLVFLIFGAVLGIVQVILAAIITSIFGESVYGITYYVNGFGRFLLVLIRIICYAPTALLFILGLINSVNGKAKELPFIGKIHIIK